MKKYLLKGHKTREKGQAELTATRPAMVAMLEVSSVAHRVVTPRLTESLILEETSKITKSNF